jgi:hypothetical protein
MLEPQRAKLSEQFMLPKEEGRKGVYSASVPQRFTGFSAIIEI